MKELKNKIYDKIGIKSLRTQNITKHIGISTFFKAGSIVSNFMLVPITIIYLDTTNYGVWLTLSSFISWFSFFDIGLGHGLRNKFTEATIKGNYMLAKGYVSSAYYTILCISLILFLLFYGVSNFVDWTKIFNASTTLRDDLNLLMPIVFGFFCLQLIAKLITSIYLADQHHSIQVKIQFYTQSLLLLIVWGLTKKTESSLLLFGTIFSALPVILLFSLNIFAFTGKYQKFKPVISLCKRKYLKDIIGIGFSFFIIQISALILLATDNFIISNLFSPKEVVPYNIAFKYMSIILIAYSIILGPYWSAFTDAYTRNDYVWIKNSVKKLQTIWILVPLLLILLIFFSGKAYYYWLGDAVEIPLKLTISMGLFVLLSTFSMTYTNFLNGVGKVKIQLISGIFSACINIPLSIILAKYLSMGTIGVILATCVSSIYSIPLRYIQYKKIITQTASGLWNK